MILLIIISIVVFIDQISKFLAIKYLKGKDSIKIIKDFLKLDYVENYGAAFGILQNQKFLFISITLIVIVAISYFIYKNYHFMNNTVKIALALLLGGAIGNLLDRIRLGYVVDFISVRLGKGYNFPVFNMADTFIVISTGIIVLLILTGKEELK